MAVSLEGLRIIYGCLLKQMKGLSLFKFLLEQKKISYSPTKGFESTNCQYVAEKNKVLFINQENIIKGRIFIAYIHIFLHLLFMYS